MVNAEIPTKSCWKEEKQECTELVQKGKLEHSTGH